MSNLVCQYSDSLLYSFEEFMDRKDGHEWDINPEDPDGSWVSYLEFESQDMFDYFCECVGERILSKGGKVFIEGSNLNWRGSNGEATFKSWGDDAQSVGRDFVFRFISCYGDFNAELYDENNGDFFISVGHHDGRSGFSISKLENDIDEE